MIQSLTFRHEKSSRLQSLIVRSAAPLATTLSVRLNLTVHIPLLCPLHVPTKRKLPFDTSISNTLTSLSCEPETRNLSFGETSRELISFSCARSVVIDRNFSIVESARSADRSHSLSVRSWEAVTRNLADPLSGCCLENATAPTDSA